MAWYSQAGPGWMASPGAAGRCGWGAGAASWSKQAGTEVFCLGEGRPSALQSSQPTHGHSWRKLGAQAAEGRQGEAAQSEAPSEAARLGLWLPHDCRAQRLIRRHAGLELEQLLLPLALLQLRSADLRDDQGGCPGPPCPKPSTPPARTVQERRMWLVS